MTLLAHGLHVALFAAGLVAVALLVLPALSPRRRRAARAHRARVAALRERTPPPPAPGPTSREM
ncbi:MAG TPA: hypothetical protein VE781_14925 [Kineosporiaceae bacterium]|nr:hypothetical protein [Kineosporiaceae bacterium]